MAHEPELASLKSIAGKIVKKQVVKKIKSVKDKSEQKILYEYSIKIALELMYADLKDRVDEMYENGKDVFVLVTKVQLLGNKVRFFNATFYKKDFLKIIRMFKNIEKELKKC